MAAARTVFAPKKKDREIFRARLIIKNVYAFIVYGGKICQT